MSAKRQTDDDATSTGNVTGNERAAKKPRLVEGWNSVTQYFMSILLPVVKLLFFQRYPEQIKRGQDFVESIMNKDYEDIPNSNGMKVLRNAIVLETGKRIDVVIRSITEDFWQTVIDTTNRSRVGAVGTPGIGKTTSTCILIRLLLQQQKTVVYHVRTKKEDGFVYMFTPTSEGSVDVKVIQEKDFNILDENINQTSTYYIVDPGVFCQRYANSMQLSRGI